MKKITEKEFQEMATRAEKYILFDWEFIPDHFLMCDLRVWVFGISVYFNTMGIEISFLCFNIIIQ